MPIKKLFKILIFTLTGLSLLACQTAPEKTPMPTPAVEASVETVTQLEDNQQADPLQPDSSPLEPQQADPQQALIDQAIESSRNGNIDNAIEQFTQIIEKDPSARRAYTNLGLLYLHKKQTEAAKVAFLKAIKNDDKDAVAYNHLAVIQRQQGEFKLAMFNYYKAINAHPEYANAHLNLGILLDIYLQQFPEALEHYENFQRLTDNSNELVKKWIIDLKRRIDADKGKSK